MYQSARASFELATGWLAGLLYQVASCRAEASSSSGLRQAFTWRALHLKDTPHGVCACAAAPASLRWRRSGGTRGAQSRRQAGCSAQV